MLQVVDVEQRCVTPITGSSAAYVALSYVWGGHGTAQLKLEIATLIPSLRDWWPRRSSRRYSTTVKHAMNLCQMLGRRYLWVDALCILQDDVEG